jgi:hypothetical protein
MPRRSRPWHPDDLDEHDDLDDLEAADNAETADGCRRAGDGRPGPIDDDTETPSRRPRHPSPSRPPLRA